MSVPGDDQRRERKLRDRDPPLTLGTGNGRFRAFLKPTKSAVHLGAISAGGGYFNLSVLTHDLDGRTGSIRTSLDARSFEAAIMATSPPMLQPTRTGLSWIPPAAITTWST